MPKVIRPTWCEVDIARGPHKVAAQRIECLGIRLQQVEAHFVVNHCLRHAGTVGGHGMTDYGVVDLLVSISSAA